uniref:SET domain-containing protein n=1 Tax=Hyaloperonospora arabidopsidis (strain Emoy2) TaxID=559515 RepID=M4C0D8_HYAAE
MAAPYGPTDPVASTYFQVNISKAKAPIMCGDAGPVKGKAIYAERDLPKATRIWTESPLVAMQHEHNRRLLPCCQFCYLPLLGDAQQQWRDIVTRYNLAQTQREASMSPEAGTKVEKTVSRAQSDVVDVNALETTLQLLRITPKNCGMADPGAKCACGELYCSKLCRMRALHEYHAILCPRNDPCSAMGEFLEHTRHTNDIFYLAVKVIARVLSRYLVWRDIVKAREPIDMFYKKPWWEVVVVEHEDSVPLPQEWHSSEETSGPVTTSGSDDTNSDDGGSSSNDDRSPSEEKGAYQKPNAALPPAIGPGAMQAHNVRQAQVKNKRERESDGGTPTKESTKAQCLQEVLKMTHELLIDALECNLVRLEREGQLRGVTVEEIWRCCSSVLSFEFFTAQIGLFEMNNISMEVDHPFRAFIDILDPDVQHEVAAGESNEKVSCSSPRLQPQLNIKDQALVASVRRVLEWEEECLQILQAQERLERSGGEVSSDFDSPPGYAGIEGTALFPIICTMNHSCDPNCTVLYTKNGDGHVVAIRDIRKGEELCICYIDVDMDVQSREANLREYKFKCYCPRCVNERQQNERHRPAQGANSVSGPLTRRSLSENQRQLKKPKNKCSDQGQ